jgi:sulfite exporter TauE/SafE
VLASDPVGGAAAMLAFGAGTAVNLMGARLAIDGIASRLADRLPGIERAGVRIGGGLIAAMALAALVALALGQPHPFCID